MKQAITFTNGDQEWWRHMASLGHNERKEIAEASKYFSQSWLNNSKPYPYR